MIRENAHMAWVPEDVGGAPRTRAINAAVDFVRSAAEGGLEMLLFHPDGNAWSAPTPYVAELVAETGTASLEFDRQRGSRDGRAVLAFVSDYEAFRLAQRVARAWTHQSNGAFAVVPHSLFGIRGWAALHEALNLSTGKFGFNSVTRSQSDEFERLRAADRATSPGRQRGMVRRAIEHIDARHDLDAEMILGYVFANGGSTKLLNEIERQLVAKQKAS